MASEARVLVIDDEQVVLDSCRQILELAGYTVATAADGASGLERVDDFAPDLVFVDLKMPGLSGFEVLKRLRTLDPTIVAIVITGYATLSSAVEAMQKGAYDFLPKPFTPEEFRLITRRGLEKRRLVQQTLALRREKEMLREHFATIVSHELKSPLAAVQQNLLLLSTEVAGSLAEAQRRRLERVMGRIDALLQMINTWLRVISTDLDKIKEGFRPTAVGTVVAKALDAVQPLAARKGIEIQTAFPDALPPVWGDEGTLVEALVNLLGNAVKYSHPDGRVDIAASLEGGRVRITVTDAGIGIPPDELPHIFGDFYRGTGGTAAGMGVGLGLAITRRIIEAHDGTITAESVPGRGSTFRLTLPAAVAAPPAPASSATEPTQAARVGGVG